MATEERLHRSTTDRVIFGVCGGIAEYLDVDPTLVRVAFVVLAAASGIGMVLYLTLAVFMPRSGRPELSQSRQIEENLREMWDRTQDLARRARAALHGTGGDAARSRQSSTMGWILVCLGVIIFLANAGAFWWIDWRYLVPLVLVAAGGVLLLRRR